MRTLSISAELRARVALEKHGFRTTHSLGQNFLFDENLLSRLLDASGVGEEDCVLEIGPGPGIMTSLLSRRCKQVLSVEIDEKLRPVLDEVLEGCENAKVVFADAMRADLCTLTCQAWGDRPFRVVANLPYYITTDVLLRLVASGLPVEDVCVMVQKEAADRMLSQPGDKQWCTMAATIGYFGRAEVLCEVPRGCFEPAPHVDSAFVRVAMYDPKPVQAISDERMKQTINAAFLMRRKKLTNNLKAAFSLTQEQAVEALERAGIDPNVRGEVLQIEELARLSDLLG